MRLARSLSTAAVSAGTIVAAALVAPSAQAASGFDPSGTLVVNQSTVMSREDFSPRGRIATTTVRPIRLQYRTGTSGSWSTKATGATDSDGYFSFNASTRSTKYFRFYAPATGGKAAIKGTPRRIKVVAQTAKAFVYPVAYCASESSERKVQVAATFTPGRDGRDVDLTVGGVTSLAGVTDGNGGYISRPIDGATTPGTYAIGVTARPYVGAAAKGVTASYTVVDC